MSFLQIAHRGASGTRPEHTRVAFERAIELHVDMIELDVQLTRDRRLAVLHDTYLGRTVAAEGLVRERTLAELRALDAGSWFGSSYTGQHVLALDDVLDMTAGRTMLNVEIKSPAPDWEVTADVLLEVLNRRAALMQTVISCFEVGALRCVRAIAPSARLGMLWHDPDLSLMWDYAAEIGAATVHPFWRLISPGVVDTAKQRGLGILTWTVNQLDEMRQLVGWGVDGIISDFPERFAMVETIGGS